MFDERQRSMTMSIEENHDSKVSLYFSLKTLRFHAIEFPMTKYAFVEPTELLAAHSSLVVDENFDEQLF